MKINLYDFMTTYMGTTADAVIIDRYTGKILGEHSSYVNFRYDLDPKYYDKEVCRVTVIPEQFPNKLVIYIEYEEIK